MKAIKDSMVLINFAKTSMLETSCSLFKKVLIPTKVYEETIIAGKKKQFPDVIIIEELINKRKIEVIKVKNQNELSRIYQFNVFGGEAEAVALYFQEKADVVVSDDDNLRRKKELLNVSIVGSLGLLLKLRTYKKINDEKFYQTIEKLRKIGWFSNAVLDAVILEGKKYD